MKFNQWPLALRLKALNFSVPNPHAPFSVQKERERERERRIVAHVRGVCICSSYLATGKLQYDSDTHTYTQLVRAVASEKTQFSLQLQLRT